MPKQNEQRAALFAEYWATGSIEVRNRLAEAYMPLVRGVAEKIGAKLPAEVDFDDLTQAGSLGLLEALASYDPARPVQFTTFAQYRVWGSIMDWLRGIDWVPRVTRTRIRRLAEAVSGFENEHGRPPSMCELRPLLPLSDQQFARLMYRPPPMMSVSLDAPVPNTGNGADGSALDNAIDRREHTPEKRLDDQDAFDGVIKLVLRDYTVTDALLLRLYFREGMTLTNVGVHLGGLTESSMSQRRKALLDKLRKRRLVREMAGLKGAA